MQIIEHTADKLVIRHRRIEMAGVMVLFTIMSVFFLINTVLQGVPRLGILNAGQVLSWVVWLVFAGGLTLLGIMMSNTAGRGTQCTFDREAEIFCLQKPNLLSADSIEASIYSVSHVMIERNEEAKALGVYLVLRSGEKRVLASVPLHDSEDAHQVAKTVREFLLRS
ncbi:MAG: hypothetical protein AAFR81_16535 [Chloroflexota bacterium]